MSTDESASAGTILDAIDDDALFARWFKDAAGNVRPSWLPWFTFLKVLFGLPLSETDLELFRTCTGRQTPLAGGYRECWLICGRRSGKSFILALIAIYLACFRDWSRYLTPGERGVIMVIATDRRQARTIHRYAAALLRETPMLQALIERDTAEAIDLANGITVEISAASYRSVRGYTVVAALCDEIAFWRSEDSANPDLEIINAIRPATATIPDAMLLCASSPYAKRGVLFDAFRRHFGRDESRVLVWKRDTRTMNPTVPQSVIDEAIEADPASAAAEYGAEFRTDIDSFIDRDAVEQCMEDGCFERAPVDARYVAFCDPAGGSGGDSMTLAIAHRERDGRVILDCIRERRSPFDPDATVQEFASLLRRYRLTTVHGDKYAGLWPSERFKAHGVRYEAAEQTKSELYVDALPLLNSNRAVLLDSPRLLTQFIGLERRTARSGKDSIDHAPGGHDDVVNAACGALTLAARYMPFIATREHVNAVIAAGAKSRIIGATGRR
jgi:Terminase large subunit, T4likevirus-type, N-terminal